MAMLHHEAGSDLGDELAYITVDQPLVLCMGVRVWLASFHGSMTDECELGEKPGEEHRESTFVCVCV